MRGRTFALSQKELQRVSVISSCVKGNMAYARAAELLSLSIRQVKRLKKRLREQGEAALAHANRGRRSPRRLPSTVRQAALRPAPLSLSLSFLLGASSPLPPSPCRGRFEREWRSAPVETPLTA